MPAGRRRRAAACGAQPLDGATPAHTKVGDDRGPRSPRPGQCPLLAASPEAAAACISRRRTGLPRKVEGLLQAQSPASGLSCGNPQARRMVICPGGARCRWRFRVIAPFRPEGRRGLRRQSLAWVSSAAPRFARPDRIAPLRHCGTGRATDHSAHPPLNPRWVARLQRDGTPPCPQPGCRAGWGMHPGCAVRAMRHRRPDESRTDRRLSVPRCPLSAHATRFRRRRARSRRGAEPMLR